MIEDTKKLMQGCGTKGYEKHYPCRAGSLCPECEAKISEAKKRLNEELKWLEQFDLRSLDSVEVIDQYGVEMWADKYIGDRISAIREELKLLEGEA